MKRKTAICWATGIFGALFLVGFAKGIGYFEVIGTANSYDHEYALAREEGAVITPALLRQHYGEHGESNDAQFYQQYLTRGNQYAKRPGAPAGSALAEEKALTKLSGHVDPELRMRADRVLNACGSVDDLLNAPKCDFHYRWEDGYGLDYPELTASKIVTKFLMVKASAALEEANRSEFEKYVHASLKVPRDIAQTPGMPAMLVQVAEYAIVYRGLADLAKAHGSDQTKLSWIRELLQVKPVIVVRPGLEGEMFLQWDMVNNMSDKTLRGLLEGAEWEKGSYSRRILFAARIPGVRTAWKVKMLQWLRKVRPALDMSAPDWREQTALFKEAGPLSYFDNPGKVQLVEIWQSLWAPVFESAFAVTQGPEAWRQIALAVTDVLEAHKNGVPWPVSLPVPRIDPYTGKPLIYHSFGDNWTVLSVGPDGTEDDHTSNHRDDRAFWFAERPKG